MALRFSILKPSYASITCFHHRSREGLYNPKQVQDDEQDDDNDQDMDPIAGFWEAGKNIPTKSTEQPEDQENDDDCPKHEISPFEKFVGATWSFDRATVDLTTEKDEDTGRDGEDRQKYPD